MWALGSASHCSPSKHGAPMNDATMDIPVRNPPHLTSSSSSHISALPVLRLGCLCRLPVVHPTSKNSCCSDSVPEWDASVASLPVMGARVEATMCLPTVRLRSRPFSWLMCGAYHLKTIKIPDPMTRCRQAVWQARPAQEGGHGRRDEEGASVMRNAEQAVRSHPIHGCLSRGQRRGLLLSTTWTY